MDSVPVNEKYRKNLVATIASACMATWFRNSGYLMMLQPAIDIDDPVIRISTMHTFQLLYDSAIVFETIIHIQIPVLSQMSPEKEKKKKHITLFCMAA